MTDLLPVFSAPTSPDGALRRPLRKWQREALSGYLALDCPDDYVVTATPGAGKTTFALALAQHLVATRRVRQIVVVAPTDHLRTQWAEAANDMGITLDPSLANSVGPVSPDFEGYVCTYAQVAAKPGLHMRRTETTPTLVILDEIHHAGDGLSWGAGIQDAFEDATHRLSLTGTPFRTKSTERIPFVRYIDGPVDDELQSEADYTYGYADALKDAVVRPVLFAAYSGVSRWSTSAGNILSADLAEVKGRDNELAAWRTALDPSGDWLPHVIAAADARLTEIRGAGMSDAGAMLLASDQDHARAAAEVVQRVTGVRPTLALSDDPRASEKIDQFRGSTDRWLVAVRLVAEGVDIPRLGVGVYATAYRTPLFFAQAIGRFVRARSRTESATVFLPAIRPLLALAADLETQRDHIVALVKAEGEEDGELDPPEDTPPPVRGDTFTALGADAAFAHLLYAGQAVTAPSPTLSDEEADVVGLPGLLDPHQIAAVLARQDAEARARNPTPAPRVAAVVGTPQASAAVEAAALRREINDLANRYAMRTGNPHAKVHAQVRAKVPGPPSAAASIEQLRGRRDYLLTL